MKTAPRLLNWIEDNKAQVWFDPKMGETGKWTCSLRVGKTIIQPSRPLLRDAIREAIAQTEALASSSAAVA